MKRTLALLLSVTVTLAGCAARVPSLGLRHDAGNGTASLQEIPGSYAAQLPVGRLVEVRLKSGERFKATFMGVEGEKVRVQRTGRIPVPPQVIALDDISAIRVAEGGTSAAKALVLGIAAGAATFFGLFLLSIAAWAD